MTASTLKAQITDAMKDAMRAKDKERLGAIRLILADIKRIEVDERIEIDDSRVLAVLDKMAKQRRESIEQFQGAGREDLAEKEQYELGLIQAYLPEPLGEEELQALIRSAIEEQGASGMRDMGKVMNALRGQVQGRADMKAVSQAVKSQLTP